MPQPSATRHAFLVWPTPMLATFPTFAVSMHVSLYMQHFWPLWREETDNSRSGPVFLEAGCLPARCSFVGLPHIDACMLPPIR